MNSKENLPDDLPDNMRGSRLAKEIRQDLLEVAYEVAGKDVIAAACVYGSRVAGYGRDDSDYDIILVLENYRHRAKYKYVRGKIDASVLIVRMDSFSDDADRASLGEFVVGRLLNVYEPLLGEAYLEDKEVRYKRRVVLEILEEVISTYGDFASEIRFPIDYFLFEKLKKRISLYPPALYSYSKTYKGPNVKENLLSTRAGFLKAIDGLETEEIISLESGMIKPLGLTSKGKIGSRLSQKLSATSRGIKSYAVHGLAGRVGPKVVGREVISKLSRSREQVELPEEIRHPRNLWEIDEGILLVDSDDWLKEIAVSEKLSTEFVFSKKRLGELYNVSNVYTLSDAEREISIAVKKFRDPRSMKWAFLNLWSLSPRRFKMAPISRLTREYLAIRTLRGIGLNTPNVVAVVLGKKILVTRFIDGMNLSEIVREVVVDKESNTRPIFLYGQAIGRSHSSGYTLGDTKPSNAIFANGHIFLTDLEQATNDGNMAWDLAEFIYYSAKLTLNSGGARMITEAFLDGYLKNGVTGVVKSSLNIRLLAPFQPLIIPTVVKAVREVMKSKSSR